MLYLTQLPFHKQDFNFLGRKENGTDLVWSHSLTPNLCLFSPDPDPWQKSWLVRLKHQRAGKTKRYNRLDVQLTEPSNSSSTSEIIPATMLVEETESRVIRVRHQGLIEAFILDATDWQAAWDLRETYNKQKNFKGAGDLIRALYFSLLPRKSLVISMVKDDAPSP